MGVLESKIELLLEKWESTLENLEIEMKSLNEKFEKAKARYNPSEVLMFLSRIESTQNEIDTVGNFINGLDKALTEAEA